MRSTTMTILAAASSAMLTACATTTTAAEKPGTIGGSCDAEKAQFAVGQPYTVELGAQVQEASGAKSMRAVGPGQAVTMDFRPDRLNVEIDEAGKIKRINCG